MFDQKVAIDTLCGVVAINQRIHLVDAAQGVFVGGVAMEELVLNQKLHFSEFREKESEDANAMHEAKDGSHFSFLAQNVLKGSAIDLRGSEGMIDEVSMRLNEFS